MLQQWQSESYTDTFFGKAQMEFINEHKRIMLGPDTDMLIYGIHRDVGIPFQVSICRHLQGKGTCYQKKKEVTAIK